MVQHPVSFQNPIFETDSTFSALLMSGITVINPILGLSIFGFTTLGLWAAEHEFLNAEKLLEAQQDSLEQIFCWRRRNWQWIFRSFEMTIRL